MLCQACTQIFEGDLTLGSVQPHCTALELRRASENGCQICRLLWTSFPGYITGNNSRENAPVGCMIESGKHSSVLGYVSGIPADLYILSFFIGTETLMSEEDREDRSCLLILEPYEDVINSTDTQVVTSHTGSEYSLVQAQKWLATCLKHHTRCKALHQPKPFRPTRLVEILPFGEAYDLRLCLANESPQEDSYMTLSHRWGNASFLKLELTNLAKLRKGFSVTDLPRTFQDAVVIARRLDCRYLWIDSLCIIQRSKEDWLYEAGLMGDVYANSLCNIAATWNLSSDDGCFAERNVVDASDLVLRSKWTDLKPTTFRIVNSRLWDDLVTSAPLNKRAWVVQERLLAPRVFHFGRTQLAWECHELDACETYPAGLPPTQRTTHSIAQRTTHSIYKGLDPDIDGKRLQSMGDAQSAPNLQAYHLWNKIVTAYTAGELTMPSDKLVAIAGVAKRLQSLLQDEYLAGLWKSTLASGLLWMVSYGRQANGLPSSRAAQYRAPSWSWAALDGQIVPGRPSVEGILISVEEAIVDPQITGDPFGQLKSGCIRLRGAMLQSNLSPSEKSSSRTDRLDVQFPSRSVNGEQWVYPDVQDEISKAAIFCLFIGVKNRYDHTQVQGLALHCIDHAQNTYQRVGLFEGEYKSPIKDLPIQYLKSTRRVGLSENADIKTIIVL